MALPGIRLVTFLAWLTGVLLIDRPWGRPTFKSWCSLTLFISIHNSLLSGLVSLDILVNIPEGDQFKDPSRMIRLINNVSFYELVTSNLLICLIYKIKAKDLAKLWGELYTRNYVDSSFKAYSYSIDKIGLAIGSGTFLIMLVVLVVEGTKVGKNYENSWIGAVGQIPYTILMIWYLLPPLIVPIATGFAASIATLFHLRKVYNTYCKRVHDLMESQSRNNVKNDRAKPSRQEMIETKEELYQEFLSIQELFTQSDSITGPIILTILSGGTLRLVVLCAKFVFHHQKEAKAGSVQNIFVDAAHLIVVIGHMYILEVGQTLKNEFSKWKERLRKKVVDLPVSTSYDAQDARDLFLMVDNWDWHLSAWGFFDVDRKLMSGVISLLLTYTVILVQTRIAIEGLSE